MRGSSKLISQINLEPTSTEFQMQCLTGPALPARSWGNATNASAVALLVHGLGAHSGWFEAFAHELEIRGICSVSYDHAGFGKQKDVPFISYKQWLDDLVRVFDYLRASIPAGKPIFLVGNSMGGLLSLVAAEFIEPDGLVLLSPGFDGSPETFTTMYRLRTIVKALLWPDLELPLPYDARLVTRDKPTQAWINADPEGRFSVPGKHLLQLLHLSNATKHKAGRVKMPVLMLTAGQDKIVNNVVNRAFYAKLVAPSKKARHFDEAWHDLMFDPLVDEVAEEVVGWMSGLARPAEDRSAVS
jgi:alpha-beta hydrolase superfamily lysophospholipase